MASIEEIVKWFKEQGNETVLSDQYLSQEIIAPKAIDCAAIDNISFLNSKNKDRVPELLRNALCKIVILEKGLDNAELINSIEGMSFILSDNPKADILFFCKEFLGFDKKIEKTEVHSSALIAEGVTIGKNVIVAANVVIGNKVEIGDNCQIGSNTVIESDTVLGNHVEIGSNSVIGGVGFGYAQDELTQQYERFPHYGRVVIRNNVSIGNNVCIDRGSLSDTIIQNGVKIDNLVHIAHNVKIGRNTLVIANAMIAGSVEIGENCWIAPSSSIRNGITIGDNVTVGLASTVTKDVASDQTVMGSPALSIEDFRKLRNQQKLFLNK